MCFSHTPSPCPPVAQPLSGHILRWAHPEPHPSPHLYSGGVQGGRRRLRAPPAQHGSLPPQGAAPWLTTLCTRSAVSQSCRVKHGLLWERAVLARALASCGALLDGAAQLH